MFYLPRSDSQHAHSCLLRQIYEQVILSFKGVTFEEIVVLRQWESITG